MKFKGSVRCNTNRERRESREQKRGVSPEDFPRRESSPFPPENGMSAVIFTAKCAKIANKKGSVPCRFKAVRGRVQGEGFPSPPGWEPKAVKEEEALVRVVCVVRGSRNRQSVRCHSNRENYFMIYFSLFVPFASFALFAVYVSKTECLLSF